MTMQMNESKRFNQTVRPGRPISKEAWNRFMESGNWETAPRIFGNLYGETESFLSVVSEKTTVSGSTGTQAKKEENRKRYYGISIVSCGKVFADAVDKNRMLRILTGEIVRWQMPVMDFMLLDDGLYLVVCKEDGRDREYMLSQFTASLEGKYAAYYLQTRGLACTFMTDNTLHFFRDHLEALEECCRIHALPVFRGNAEDIREYWFSGYLSIQGKFAWNCMDPTPLLSDVADQPGKAVRYCVNAHKSYLVRNGITTKTGNREDRTSPKEK